MDTARIHLGRDTDTTVKHWDAIASTMPVAPMLCMGPRPRKSPNNRAFRNPRYRGQLAGTCVGEQTTSMVETLLRMPPDRAADPQPTAPKDLSPLLTYWLARRWSAEHGVRLGGEGAIVSHAIQAIHQHGLASWDEWPATDEAYGQYSDALAPAAQVMAEADEHPVKQYAILDSFEAVLGALAVGFTVSFGVPIPEGIMRTAADGRFEWTGSIVGGHCMELLDYDEDLDRAWIGNSWANARWGARSDDPQWRGRCQGYTNIGYCSLTALAQVFSPRAMSYGEAEAVVANNVVGWAPKVRSFVEVL